MSYCVNCGVELEKTERICPLCGVEVNNPREPHAPFEVRPYPTRLDPVNAKINRRFIAAILSIALAFPVILSIVVNLVYSGHVGWSLYVAGSLAMFWVWLVPPFLWRRSEFLRIVAPDLLAVLLFLFLIYAMNPRQEWFRLLALPLVLLSSLLILLIGWLISSHRLRGFYIPAVIIAASGSVVPAIEILTERFAVGSFKVDWSLYVLIPGLAVSAVLIAIARRQSVREEIHKRLHI